MWYDCLRVWCILILSLHLKFRVISLTLEEDKKAFVGADFVKKWRLI